MDWDIQPTDKRVDALTDLLFEVQDEALGLYDNDNDPTQPFTRTENE